MNPLIPISAERAGTSCGAQPWRSQPAQVSVLVRAAHVSQSSQANSARNDYWPLTKDVLCRGSLLVTLGCIFFTLAHRCRGSVISPHHISDKAFLSVNTHRLLLSTAFTHPPCSHGRGVSCIHTQPPDQVLSVDTGEPWSAEARSLRSSACPQVQHPTQAAQARHPAIGLDGLLDLGLGKGIGQRTQWFQL